MKHYIFALLAALPVTLSFCTPAPAAKGKATSASAGSAFEKKMKNGKCCSSKTPARFPLKRPLAMKQAGDK